ncbi:glycoside hydrolase family 30 protein [Pustulibacterium marinum]|nr:glycoside hydrolase family 30 beta sandwich domain-containing protein [Pustulibacterium marinum]
MKLSTKKLTTMSLGLSLLCGVVACDEQPAKETNLPKGKVYVTSMDETLLLAPQDLPTHTEEEIHTTIQLDTATTYQTMDGFGYTLTGGSAMHLHNMSAPARKELLEELFGDHETSVRVNYLRISIGASDLDEAPFSYDDLPEGTTDVPLEHFTLAHDTLDVVPMLKEILAINPKIQLLGSPWSPPVWMKDNHDTRGGSLLPEYYETYARYFVKYIRAMEAEGITINAMTIQNEPLHPGNNPSLLMLPEQQSTFIKEHLGPLFKEEGINTKIILYDHNADRPDYPISILDDPETAQYVDGAAFHLYGGEIDAVSKVHEAHPNKHLYFTEQWVGAPGDFAKEMNWHTENLIIGAPRNWCKTVLEWNLAADANQQPHTDRGGCDRCLGAVTITGDNVTRNPAYYIIAQAAKFVRAGAVRIASTMEKELPNVAYQNPDGSLVVIVQNKSTEKRTFYIDANGTRHLAVLDGETVGTFTF